MKCSTYWNHLLATHSLVQIYLAEATDLLGIHLIWQSWSQ